MWEFAMHHEVICLIVVLSAIAACAQVLTAFANRNNPVCDCSCCDEDEDDDSSEVVAAGGEEEDDS